jgi:hypothetical protein
MFDPSFLTVDNRTSAWLRIISHESEWIDLARSSTFLKNNLKSIYPTWLLQEQYMQEWIVLLELFPFPSLKMPMMYSTSGVAVFTISLDCVRNLDI